MAELVFLRRGEEMMRVLLDGHAMVLGRGSTADIAVPHPEVSRRQALIERRGERFVAIDLSGRGIRLDGAEVAEGPLDDGSELVLGDYRAVFRLQSTSTHGETRSGGGEFTRDAGNTRRVNVPVNLRVRSASGERTRPLEGEVVIGTDSGCDLMLDDAFASGVHCRLILDGGRIQLFDLGSTNGTWVNGLRVGHAELALGSTVRIGETEISLEPVDRKGDNVFEGIVSGAACMREVFDLVDRVAPSSAAVTILGETGTGKELIARAIHARSERNKGRFVPVNCAAISRELVESELFGHEKGAFTGALAARKGAFEEASGGTIFLDEIGELSADLQAKLLRTLELGEVKRVGSSRPFRVDARVVAATHRDLRAMVRTGAFREDLYYRLAVIRVELPPLRRRPGDVPLLVDRLARAFAPRGGMPGFTPEAMRRLEAHPWPGNVRELKNVLARALLLRRGAAIGPDDLSFDETGAEMVASVPTTDEENEIVRLPGKTLHQIELEATLKALRRHKGNRRAAARELDMARSTMQLRAKELGVPPPSNDSEE